ncbi:MAG: hypothetical protein AcusKO_09190 [Acuticoccus sp.]
MKITKRDIITATIAAVFTTGVVTAAVAQQTRMENAVKYLKLAKDELQKANPNKGGHRVKAMNLIDEAIQQVRMGKRFADAH